METELSKESPKEVTLEDIRRQADLRASARAALRAAGILIDLSDHREPVDIADQFGLLDELRYNTNND